MKKQQGMSTFGALIVIIVLVMLALLTMRLLPMYQEYYSVKVVMASMEKEMKASPLSKQQAFSFLMKRLDSSYVTSVEKQHVKFYQRRSGSGISKIVVDYEVRNPLVKNLDIVGKFHAEAHAN